MKTARIEVDGEAQLVQVAAEGGFRDHAGRPVTPSRWNRLPPSRTVIYGLALNFADHARELNFAEVREEPIPFIKNPSSVVGHQVPVARPAGVKYMALRGGTRRCDRPRGAARGP